MEDKNNRMKIQSILRLLNGCRFFPHKKKVYLQTHFWVFAVFITPTMRLHHVHCTMYNVAVWTVKSKWRGKNYNIKFIPHRTLKRSELWKTPKTHIENVFSAFGCIAHTMMILYSIYDPQEQFRKKKRLKKISYSNDVTTHSAIRIETLNS